MEESKDVFDSAISYIKALSQAIEEVDNIQPFTFNSYPNIKLVYTGSKGAEPILQETLDILREAIDKVVPRFLMNHTDELKEAIKSEIEVRKMSVMERFKEAIK